MNSGTGFLVAVTLGAAVSLITSVTAQHGTRRGEWRSYNGDAGSRKYAPLDQINKSNVSKLEILWRRPAVDASVMARNPDLRFSNNFRASPIMVNGALYSPNGIGLVEAFHPATGRTLWVGPAFTATTADLDWQSI